jgi:DNA-directed RNA polymerase subunit RPC12/RpoP
MSYDAPLRCQECGVPIVKKPKAKTPKYCSPCRMKQQDAYRDQLKINRQRKVRGR